MMSRSSRCDVLLFFRLPRAQGSLHAGAHGSFMTNACWALCRLYCSCFLQVIDMIAGIDDPKRAVDVLIAEANARWMKEEQVIDDTTVIVAFLDVTA